MHPTMIKILVVHKLSTALKDLHCPFKANPSINKFWQLLHLYDRKVMVLI